MTRTYVARLGDDRSFVYASASKAWSKANIEDLYISLIRKGVPCDYARMVLPVRNEWAYIGNIYVDNEIEAPEGLID